jgi:hypothetical protein
MRPILLATLAALIVAPALAQAPAGAAPTGPQAAQRARMTNCNATASSQKLSGDTRKTFMADCLAGQASAPPPATKPLTAQQSKMKTCNADASGKSLKGKERRAFMSTCLKG